MGWKRKENQSAEGQKNWCLWKLRTHLRLTSVGPDLESGPERNSERWTGKLGLEYHWEESQQHGTRPPWRKYLLPSALKIKFSLSELKNIRMYYLHSEDNQEAMKDHQGPQRTTKTPWCVLLSAHRGWSGSDERAPRTITQSCQSRLTKETILCPVCTVRPIWRWQRTAKDQQGLGGPAGPWSWSTKAMMLCPVCTIRSTQRWRRSIKDHKEPLQSTKTYEGHNNVSRLHNKANPEVMEVHQGPPSCYCDNCLRE